MPEKPKYVFLIGAPKCGTSTLAHWLDSAPQICLSRQKEPRFFTDFSDRQWSGPYSEKFASSIARSSDDYAALFAHGKDAQWRLDASTDYLSCMASVKKLRALSQEHKVKVVAILRDPVERIVSEYQHTLRDGYQNNTLRESLALEEERRLKGMHPLFRHVERSLYSEQITRYADIFGSDLLVLDYHSEMLDGSAVSRVANFLDVDVPAADVEQRVNKGHVSRSKTIEGVMKSKLLRNIARKLVPSSLRKKSWHLISSANTTTYSPAAGDLAFLRDALASELEACRVHRLIDTSRWTTSFPAA